MAATVAGQQNAAEYMLADAVLGFSAEKSDCCLIPEELEAALKTYWDSTATGCNCAYKGSIIWTIFVMAFGISSNG